MGRRIARDEAAMGRATFETPSGAEWGRTGGGWNGAGRRCLRGRVTGRSLVNRAVAHYNGRIDKYSYISIYYIDIYIYIFVY